MCASGGWFFCVVKSLFHTSRLGAKAPLITCVLIFLCGFKLWNPPVRERGQRLYFTQADWERKLPWITCAVFFVMASELLNRLVCK